MVVLFKGQWLSSFIWFKYRLTSSSTAWAATLDGNWRQGEARPQTVLILLGYVNKSSSAPTGELRETTAGEETRITPSPGSSHAVHEISAVCRVVSLNSISNSFLGEELPVLCACVLFIHSSTFGFLPLTSVQHCCLASASSIAHGHAINCSKVNEVKIKRKKN